MNLSIARLGIVGTGLMGRGIAQIAAQAGIATLLYDARPDAAAEARQSIVEALCTLATKGKLTDAQAAAAGGNLHVTHTLTELAHCDAVIEAIVENLDAKKTLFAQLETIVSEHCLLATNTSSLSVTAIAAACSRPERVAGFHFFSPVPRMKIVEVIDGALTASGVAQTLVALAQRMGHTPVRAKDTPGFIVNHAGRGYGTEALRIVGEGVAEFHIIDRILRDSVGFRLGPFELLDLTGLDVSQPVMESIYTQFYHEPRFRPSPLLAQRLAAGLLGRKTGQGFYRYRDGVREPELAQPVPTITPTRVWVSRANVSARQEIESLLGKLKATLDVGERPAADALIVVAPIGQDATTAAMSEGLDATRTVALDTLFDLARHRTLMTTPITLPAMRDAAHGLFAADAVPVSVIRDSAGFVVQRVLAHIVNIACDIAQQRIATPRDIDRAVMLGLGYPQGPLALGDALGGRRVLAILDNLYRYYGDPRYRASPWLRRRAALEASLLTIEA